MRRFDPGSSRGMRRLRLGLGVALFSGLAVVALYFVLGLSEEPGLRWRYDFSEVGRNSLDPTTVDLLAKIDEPVVAHVFFRRERTLKAAARDDARERVMDLLLVASKLAPAGFSFKTHDLSDLAAASAEMQRLDVNEVNTVVLEQGDRHVVLRLEPDFCELGPDPLDPRRFAVASFHGEEALVDGLLKVAAENRPKVLFSTGHAEPDPESDAPEGASALVRALGGDGFDVGLWSATQNGPIGDDVDVLAILAPEDPMTSDELRLVRDFVGRGGSLFVALGVRRSLGEGTPGELLSGYGMRPLPGVVCLPTMSKDIHALTTGLPACAEFQIEEAGYNTVHPITKPLWAAARKLTVLQMHALERTVAPPGGTLQELLVERDGNAWSDLPGATGVGDFDWDMSREARGPFALAMAGELASREDGRRARIIGLGGGSIALNYFVEAPGTSRDFIMNCFNWLAERDFNVRLNAKRDERAMLDVVRGEEILTLQRLAWFGLPGLLALVGLFLAWRRKH